MASSCLAAAICQEAQVIIKLLWALADEAGDQEDPQGLRRKKDVSVIGGYHGS